MKNIAMTVALTALLIGAHPVKASSANLEYFHDYEKMYLDFCMKTHGAKECQVTMERLQQKLRAEDFARLVADTKLLEIVSIAK
jgi:hypothetical protein